MSNDEEKSSDEEKSRDEGKPRDEGKSGDEESPITPDSGDVESKSARTLQKSDVHFAFGPQNWHFVRCEGKWRFVRSNLSDWSNVGIDDALWVAFKHTTGFLIGGDDEDGAGRTVHSYNDGYMVKASEVDAFVKSRDAYAKLHDWICDHCGTDVEKIRDVSVTIGPKGGYFARCGTSWISHALPKDLQSILEKGKDRHSPVHVALGIKGAWIVLWSNGQRNWNLRHAYNTLASSNHLSNRNGWVVFAALNPYEEDSYFVVVESGGCVYNLSLSTNNETLSLHKLTDEYMRMRAKRDGTIIKESFTRDGVTTQTTFTPNSHREPGKVNSLMETWIGRRSLPMQNDVTFVGVVAGGAGMISKIAGIPTTRAVGIAASTGVGAAFTLWYRR